MYPYNNLKLILITDKPITRNTEELIRRVFLQNEPTSGTEAFIKSYYIVH